MDKKGPGSLRDLGSFERLHPPFIDLTLMSRRRAVHCLHTCRWPTLETGPRYQQNCADCHKENAWPVRSEPQESHAAPWRLQSVANRPVGIRAAKGSPPNSSARHVQDSAKNEQRAKPNQEHSRLSIHLCHPQQNRDSRGRRAIRSGPAEQVCGSATDVRRWFAGEFHSWIGVFTQPAAPSCAALFGQGCTTSFLSSTARRPSTVRVASRGQGSIYSPRMRLASSTARISVS
jgi:hypothetical protein